MAVLINGNGYSPVTAQQDADLYAGIIGQSLTILNVGSKMAATVIDNNTVRIADGEAVCQGRRIHNDPGVYDDFTIPTGSQGITSYYIIGYRLYTNQSNEEVAETFVEHMNSASETIPEAVLRDGAAEAYISFYRITVTGLSITAVTPLFTVPPSTDGGFIDRIYPVGSIYLSVNSTNPTAYFGGTWVAWGSGRVPVGVNTSDSSFNTVEKTGGEKTHTLTATEMPTHAHTALGKVMADEPNKYASVGGSAALAYTAGTGFNNLTNAVGGNGAHNNVQPYITCYMWKRTA